MNWLDENPVIASGVSKAAAKAATRHGRANNKRKDYSQNELRQIFSSPVFVNPSQEHSLSDFGQAAYWVPLLMYYTGARREEIAQLRTADVHTSPSGVHYLDILTSTDDEDRGVKTESSKRLIPLHDDLIAKGFMDYVKAQSPNGQLFPKLKPSPSGYFGTNFGKRWANYLRDVVGLESTASPSHGFRHTFKTLCRKHHIPADVADAIAGHAAPTIGRTYGHMPIETMYAALRLYPAVSIVTG